MKQAYTRSNATRPWTIAGLPPGSMSPVPIYTPEWRETKWTKVPCLWKQLDGWGLKPGPPPILILLSKLDVAKATGLDQIFNKILKLATSVIYRQLTDLFNLPLLSDRLTFKKV